MHDGDPADSLEADLIMPRDDSMHRSMNESCPRCSQLVEPKLEASLEYAMIEDFTCTKCHFGWTNFFTELGGPIAG